MAFKGWPVEAIEFYEGLLADNTRTFWQANKATYDACVLQPMLELLAELELEFGTGKVFRPYRDVRFSADKSPYKTAIGATCGDGYVQVSIDGLGVGSGMYDVSGDELGRLRLAVADDKTGPKLQAIVDDLRAKQIDVTAHSVLKTVPRGYPKDHPRADLLRYKGLVAWKEWPVGAWLGTAKAKQRVVDVLRAAAPLNGWLHKHVA